MEETEKEINELKGQKDEKQESFYGRKEMLSLQFKSINSDIDYCIPCIKKDIFVDIEKKLYEKYPKYLETDNYFLFGGTTIFRFKTIEENKLKSGSKIILHYKIIEN